jgi:hypothetical protein
MDRPKVSYFPKLKDTTISSELDACEVIERIKNPESRVQETIRALREAKTKNQADTLKKSLPAVTWSGLFTKRKKDALSKYSGLLCADLDHVNDPPAIVAKMKAFPFIFAAFISPSGTGVKVVFRVGDNPHDHGRTFDGIDAFLRRELGHAPDPQAKDLPRLCFISHDPNAFLNPDATPFPIEPQTEANVVTQIHRYAVNADTQVVIGSGSFAVSPTDNFEWVNPHLPTAPHQTHRLMFDLARAALTQEKKLGRVFSTKETKAIFDHWHQSSDPMFLSQPRSVYFIEFLLKRHGAKKPLDEGTLQTVWEKAKTKPPPPETEDLPDLARQLASLCRELSTVRDPFFLSNRSAAALLGVDAMAVNRSLQMLCGLRVLECVEKGKLADRKASEYRYHGSP